MGLGTIADWELEAEEENVNLFYVKPGVPDLLTGRKNLVVGPKGAGKTAVYEYIKDQCESNGSMIRTLDLNSFSYAKTSEFCKNVEDITCFWKTVIYTNCLEMVQARTKHSQKGHVLNWFGKTTEDILYHIMDNDLEIKVKGISLKLSKSLNWQTKSANARQAFIDVVQEANNLPDMFVAFDRLDIGCRDKSDFPIDSTYMRNILGLVRACLEVRRENKDLAFKLLPIAMVREDIYTRLRDPDKGKWRDRTVDLVWGHNEIKFLLEHRIAYSLGISSHSFASTWEKAFEQSNGTLDEFDGKTRQFLEYIDIRTFRRPRDYIAYIKQCASHAHSNRETKINAHRITRTEPFYSSEYFLQEIEDASLASFEDRDILLNQLQTVIMKHKSNKRFYHIDDFKNILKTHSLDTDACLQRLYEANIIGNQPPSERVGDKRYATKAKFAYKKDRWSFQNNMDIVIHPGIYRALRPR